jgi:hypothetical protein
MGIPHGALQSKGPRNFNEPSGRSPLKNQSSDFPSFEDTFKPIKKPGEKTAEVPFDDLPVGGGSQPPQSMQMPESIHRPQNVIKKQPEATVTEFNSPKKSAEMNIRQSPNGAKFEADRTTVDPNVINVDEIKIPLKQQLTFEQLLEKELNEKENNSTVLPPDDDRVIRKKPKKEFLKRTSKKTKVPKEDKSSRKYKYYADHFQHKDSKKNTTASGSEHDKSDRSKSTSKSRVKQDNDNKSDDNNSKPDDAGRKKFLSKGQGLGGGKGNVPSDNLPTDNQDLIHSTPKFNHEDEDELDDNQIDQRSPDSSAKSRRSRKARGPHHSIDHQDDNQDQRKSLEEFEEFEKNLENNDEYEVVTRKGKRDVSDKSKKSKNDANSKPDLSKTMKNNQINETGAERQRLAKEKQEFRKQKEKFETDKLAIEKQKRDMEKQKHEFEKTKDIEMKKLNAEKQKIEKERKAMNRQNDKKKDDTTNFEKLYKEIDLLKEELRKKDNKVRLLF